MKEARVGAVCAVYEGRIVVTGGVNYDRVVLNTGEAYSHVTDTWTPKPSMTKGRRNHSLVAMGNKLYVIGSLKEPFEMYDSTCKSFVALKGTPKSIELSHL